MKLATLCAVLALSPIPALAQDSPHATYALALVLDEVTTEKLITVGSLDDCTALLAEANAGDKTYVCITTVPVQ